jgi:hypothetical protein
MTGHQVGSYGPLVSTADHPTTPAPTYEIRLAGRLAPRWSAWFDGLTVTSGDDGTTVLRGPVIDQAALHGVLQKLRDLGIPLISLNRIPSDEPGERPARTNPKET